MGAQPLQERRHLGHLLEGVVGAAAAAVRHVVEGRPKAGVARAGDVEFLHVLRWLCGRGALTDHQAEQALRNFARLAIRRYSHVPLTGRIWELRAHLTAYDAAFVALAEILDVPLLTMDRKLARAHGPRVTIECFA